MYMIFEHNCYLVALRSILAYRSTDYSVIRLVKTAQNLKWNILCD